MYRIYGRDRLYNYELIKKTESFEEVKEIVNNNDYEEIMVIKRENNTDELVEIEKEEKPKIYRKEQRYGK